MCTIITTKGMYQYRWSLGPQYNFLQWTKGTLTLPRGVYKAPSYLYMALISSTSCCITEVFSPSKMVSRGDT